MSSLTTTTSSTIEQRSLTTVAAPARQSDIGLSVVLFLAAFGTTLIWHFLDHRTLTADEAGHVLNSLTAQSLIVHSKPWQLHWWYQLVTISKFYPPAFYWVGGIAFLICGAADLTQFLTMSLYMGLLAVSVQRIGVYLTGSMLIGSLAGLCLLSYPLISGLSHTSFLDLPAVAMTACAAWALLWSRSGSSPSTKRTLATACAFALACLTKQTCAAYLAPLGIYCLLIDVAKLLGSRRDGKYEWGYLLHTCTIAVVSLLLISPFYVVNYPMLHAFLERNADALAKNGIHKNAFDQIWSFSKLIPDAMSPFMTVLFLTSFSFSSVTRHRQLLPITILSLGGLCLVSASPGVVNDYRYIMPTLLAPAFYTAVFIRNLFHLNDRYGLGKLLSVLVIALVCYNYLIENYSSLSKFPAVIGKSYISYYSTQTPVEDWGYAAVVDAITRSGDKHVLLNILPNSDTIHINGYRLFLAKKSNFDILPIGSRIYTITGDDVGEFNRSSALQDAWYLLKTGSPGFMFNNQNSYQHFQKLVSFVRESGQFALVLKKQLPDSSELMLYRRCRSLSRRAP